MELSGLNNHRKKFHFIDHNHCLNCNSPNEDIAHFFLTCPAYAAQRGALLDHMEHLLPNAGPYLTRLDSRSNQRKLVKFLIFGTKIEEIDIKLFGYAAKFIEETSRF